MDKKFDLHCHSTASDGVLPPSDVVQRAHDNGVTHLALTDHDTLAGFDEAQAAAQRLGVTLISGLELSTIWNGKNIHVVGLGVDVNHAPLLHHCEQQHRKRRERAESIASVLTKLGVKDALAGAEALAGSGSIGRPHFARHMVETGFVASEQKAFKKYLGTGKPADIPSNWPTVTEAVGWIRDAGGVAVLAHPLKYKMTRTKLCRVLETFVDAGGQAMEVISGNQQTVSETRDLQRLAHDFGLQSSLGSDFHTPEAPWHDLGRCPELPTDAIPVWQSLMLAA